MPAPCHRWLRFAVSTGAAIAVWAVAAVNGYAWQMLWLPGVIAGAAWPINNKHKHHRSRGRRSPRRGTRR